MAEPLKGGAAGHRGEGTKAEEEVMLRGNWDRMRGNESARRKWSIVGFREK